MTAVIVILIFLLLIVIASRSSVPNEDISQPPATMPDKISRPTWEKDHFINKRLHRDDKKHDRHKRNQFPL